MKPQYHSISTVERFGNVLAFTGAVSSSGRDALGSSMRHEHDPLSVTHIYGLFDQHDKLRYIGKTVNKPQIRLAEHVSEARKGVRNHRCNWIRKMLSDGAVPSIIEIETVQGNGCEDERLWIALFRSLGADLVNATTGGEGAVGCRPNLETRLKMGAARRGRKHTEETKRKIGESHRGWVPSAEVRRKIGAAHLGSKRTPAVCKKLSLMRQGRRPSAEAIKHMCEAQRGHSVSAATRLKISEKKKQTHCKYGHALTGDNIRTGSYGKRYCVLCHQKRDREYSRIKRLLIMVGGWA